VDGTSRPSDADVPSEQGAGMHAMGRGRRAPVGRGRHTMGGVAVGVLVTVLAVLPAALGGAAPLEDPPVVAGDDAATAAGECRAPLAPGMHTVDVVQQGVTRPLQLWVPRGYTGGPIPLVFWLHGSSTSGAQAMATVGADGRPLFPSDADEHGYALAAPTGAVPFSPAPGFSGFAWNIPGVPLVGTTTYPPPGTLDDVAYIGLAIDAISQTICVDERRVYASGASGGGRMASQLACDLADRITAIAPIMGVRAPQTSDTPGRSVGCSPSRAVPVLAIHGRLDPVNVFAGDDPRLVPGSSWTYGVEEAVRRWAVINGCSADAPERTAVRAHVDLVRYRGCPAGGDVALYDVADGGHTIPRTPAVPSLAALIGPTNQELDTPDAIWSFVSRFRLPAAEDGYWLLAGDGTVRAFGGAVNYGGANDLLAGRAVDLAVSPAGDGYWVVDELGHVEAFGGAVDHGDAAAHLPRDQRVVAITASPSGFGYRLVTDAGRVYAFGDATHEGGLTTALNAPIIDAATTATGYGYHLVAADGGVFAFGDATFAGSTGALTLNEPVVGVAADPDGAGYWLVAADGGVFAFAAPFRGSVPGSLAPGERLAAPVRAIGAYGDGYLMAAADGGAFVYSNRAFAGSAPSSTGRSVVAVAALP
jgi:polyhydroxybutyrate depolymerase